MNNGSGLKVIVSNGFNRFHLSRTAAEIHKRGLLARFITGAYPTPAVRRLAALTRFDHWSVKAARLLDRGEKELPDDLVAPLWLSEAVNLFQAPVRRLGWPKGWAEDNLIAERACRLYGFQAARYVAETAAQIYQYRAGFGHNSVQVAKRKGMLAVCEHSAAHPAVFAHLIDTHGKLPPPGCKGPINRFWCSVLEDIGQADAVIVASEFVKETFIHQGWDPARLHVAYFGIDDKFFDCIPERPSITSHSEQPVRFLFTGEWGWGKGADLLAEAFRRIRDLPWKLEVIGDIDPTLIRAAIQFLHEPGVNYLGTLPRAQVAARMTAAEAFIFPSLSEGSARVTSEAMACGLYMITTPNACDIVKDGINGNLVPAGDIDALEAAIRFAIGDRHILRAIGLRNAELIRSRYRQSDYGDALAALYSRLLADRDRDGPGPASPSAGVAI
jgi:glycosyltransferase involved in cell wall biosynthesis